MRNIKYIFIIIFVLLSISSIGQNGIVRFIKAVPKTSHNNTSDSVIIYPIFLFKNKTFTANVNRAVKENLYELHEMDKSLPIKNVLDSLANEGLSELGYEAVTNNNKFFTFLIYMEWIAAYPTYHNSYFSFDKLTGQRLTIDSLILPEKKESFDNLVLSLWKDSLVKYRQGLITELENKEIDSADYYSLLEYIDDDCLSSYSMKDFKLEEDALVVYFECGLPRVMRPLDPSGGIRIPLQTIKEFLKPRYR